MICPVRKAETQTDAIKSYVESLERGGASVYCPARDTDQSDAIGLAICRANLAALSNADVVHVWFDTDSRGSLFDFGAAMALGKRIVLANHVEHTEGKSFQNVLLAIQEEQELLR